MASVTKVLTTYFGRKSTILCACIYEVRTPNFSLNVISRPINDWLNIFYKIGNQVWNSLWIPTFVVPVGISYTFTLYYAKSKSEETKYLIPLTQESIGYCTTYPDFRFSSLVSCFSYSTNGLASECIVGVSYVGHVFSIDCCFFSISFFFTSKTKCYSTYYNYAFNSNIMDYFCSFLFRDAKKNSTFWQFWFRTNGLGTHQLHRQ